MTAATARTKHVPSSCVVCVKVPSTSKMARSIRRTSRCRVGCGAHTRQPARHVPAVSHVVVAELSAQGGLFIQDDEQMEAECTHCRIEHETHVAEEQGLAEKESHH